MTVATKTPPAHGTYARANGSPGYRPPCYCDPCVVTKRKARKRSKVNRELGRSAFTDAAPAREHITLLHQSMSWSSISKATGVDDRSLCLIYSGRRAKIARTTLAKITAVPIPETASAWLYVDSTGTVRRIRALMAIGHSGRAIAAVVHTGEAHIHRLSSGVQPKVRRTVAARVEAAYKHLAYRPAAANRFTTRVRSTAARKGWHGPLAWDPAVIDNPEAQPDAEQCPANEGAAPTKRTEVEHLARFGITEDEICQRTGASTAYVRQIVTELHSGQRRVRTKGAA